MFRTGKIAWECYFGLLWGYVSEFARASQGNEFEKEQVAVRICNANMQLFRCQKMGAANLVAPIIIDGSLPLLIIWHIDLKPTFENEITKQVIDCFSQFIVASEFINVG